MNTWDYSDPLYLQIEKFFEELSEQLFSSKILTSSI